MNARARQGLRLPQTGIRSASKSRAPLNLAQAKAFLADTQMFEGHSRASRDARGSRADCIRRKTGKSEHQWKFDTGPEPCRTGFGLWQTPEQHSADIGEHLKLPTPFVRPASQGFRINARELSDAERRPRSAVAADTVGVFLVLVPPSTFTGDASADVALNKGEDISMRRAYSENCAL